MQTARRVIWTAACLTLAAGFALGAQTEKDRPRLTLKAAPKVARSPARVVLTADLIGGANDFEEYYCPTVSWDWGDGTESESTLDCQPYESGKSEIKRHFTVEHVFTAGNRTVTFRLKRRDKELAAANVQLQIEPGIRDMPSAPEAGSGPTAASRQRFHRHRDSHAAADAQRGHATAFFPRP